MEKVLVTGGAGFIGSNFVYKFLELGHEVHLIVRKDSNFSRIEPVKNRISLHRVDMTEERETNEFIKELEPNVILHFAVYGVYPSRQTEIETTISTNVLSTINLLNACSNIGFKCFINTGSSSEYGEKDHPMSEKDLLEPNNLYGVSKAAGTLYCQYLAKKMNLPVVTMRLFSPYGYYEDESRLIPSVVRAALTNEEFKAPSPSPVRDFVFIEDVMDAYLKVIDKSDSIKGRIFNIASGVQRPIGEVVKTVEKILGRRIKTVYGKVAARQHEPTMWVADISRARSILGWEPKNSLEEGLTKYLAWAKDNLLTANN